jgi:hypothetical protein
MEEENPAAKKDSNKFRLEPIEMSYNDIEVKTPQNYILIPPEGYMVTFPCIYSSWTVLPDGSTVTLIQDDKSEDKE